MKDVQRGRSARGYERVAPDFLPREVQYLETGAVHAFFLVDGEPLVCSIVTNNGGQPLVVRGVVSSDCSETEAFSSFRVPGRSTASMLWPAMAGDPGAIRTRDPQIRNLVLYPAELRGLP